MNVMLQNAIQEQNHGNEDSSASNHMHHMHHGGSSPSKNALMSALSKPRVSQEPIPSLNKLKNDTKKRAKNGLIIPTKIEDVPFRRQDRRVLSSRRKRIVHRYIIKCSLLVSMLLLALGAAFLTLFFIFNSGENTKYVNPFRVIGAIIILCGLMFIAFTVETCLALRANLARVQDPEIDKVKNLHLVKHWIEPELIPFGWGHSSSDSEGISTSMHDDGSMLLNEGAEDRATLKDDDVYAGNVYVIDELEMIDNPHLAMKQMEDDRNSPQSPIPPDIFDESLRYSGVNRPSLSIRRSSPIPVRRGSFEDPHEKIARLFSTTKGTRL